MLSDRPSLKLPVPHLGQVDIKKKMKQQLQVINEELIKGIPLLLKIVVKNIVARSFVNLNRCNQLVIRQKHVSYCLILNENTQRIPFVDRNVFKRNRTQ